MLHSKIIKIILIREFLYPDKQESFVWSCPDVTGWCDVTVSSRQGMAGALTDGSTETFWESGDEDRNKAKWIQVSYPGGTPDDRPHIICVHVDNTRDTVVSQSPFHGLRNLLCLFSAYFDAYKPWMACIYLYWVDY